LRSAQRWLWPRVAEEPAAQVAQVAEAPARVPAAQVVEAPVPLAEPLVMAAEVAQAPVQVPPAEGDRPQPSAGPVTPPT
jgi:hypothetical protein